MPPELRQYADTRRFLALQMADAQNAGFELPHDDAELIALINAGELVRLAPLTDTYLLYDIGEDVTDDPLMHYDATANKEVPLLPSMAAVEERRAELQKEGARGRAPAALLERYYGDPRSRKLLFREYQDVTSFAAKNGYAVSDVAERTRLHRDLLTYVRPQARDVLVEVADAYRHRFGRRLPITSLIRTELYQRRLSGVNPNATRVEIPPHTTGEAFDISYRYMAADEQNFVMGLVAKLEGEQKVEALRERRGHLHVYAFSAGKRPPEATVNAARGLVDIARAERAEGAPRTRTKTPRPSRARAAVKRTSPRSMQRSPSQR